MFQQNVASIACSLNCPVVYTQQSDKYGVGYCTNRVPLKLRAVLVLVLPQYRCNITYFETFYFAVSVFLFNFRCLYMCLFYYSCNVPTYLFLMLYLDN